MKHDSPTRGTEPAASSLPLHTARALGLRYDIERSFKMAPRSLIWERYLLGIDTATLDARTVSTVLDTLAFPARYRQAFEEGLPRANAILLGYEQGPSRSLYKVYLEFWDQIKAEVRRAPGDRDPKLMFLGFKWDPQHGAAGHVTRYHCYPLLSVKEILQRISPLLSGPGGESLIGAVESLVRLAALRVSTPAFKYLEATEEGNARRSFDLNLYDAQLPMREVAPVALALGRHYRLDIAELEQRCARVGAALFGHLSAGLDRQGESFFSVYYEPAQEAEGGT